MKKEFNSITYCLFIIFNLVCLIMDSNKTFKELGLSDKLVQITKLKGFSSPTPIQVLVIPALLKTNKNIIARARTGTGKTAAFALPLIQSIVESKKTLSINSTNSLDTQTKNAKTSYIKALLLEPTRELAAQAGSELASFSSSNKVKISVIYGGASYTQQLKELRETPDIVVGTPGRIKDHLESHKLNLKSIDYFILDEGDRMLDMGFLPDIETIMKECNPLARILLFSATIPPEVTRIAKNFMGEYQIIEEEKVDTPLLIKQKFWYMDRTDKSAALTRLLDMIPDFYGIIFTMTKKDASEVCVTLNEKGFNVEALHGDIVQVERENILQRLRDKKTMIVVATDVASRGLDITGLSYVVNYSLPDDFDTYIHRIGRTGRAGEEGESISFITPSQRKLSRYIKDEMYKRNKIAIKEEEIPSVSSVLKVKENAIYNKIKDKLLAANSTTKATTNTFLDMAKRLTEEFNISNSDILANILEMFYSNALSPARYGVIKRQEDKKDYIRLYIKLGREKGYTPKTLAAFLSNLLHIPNYAIDNIKLTSSFSLVSLPQNDARRLLEMAKTNRSLPHIHLDTERKVDKKITKKVRRAKPNLHNSTRRESKNPLYQSKKSYKGNKKVKVF